ncbi:hypothetical protein IWX92DRAFT_357602 [Phyllosticta citricarpa]
MRLGSAMRLFLVVVIFVIIASRDGGGRVIVFLGRVGVLVLRGVWVVLLLGEVDVARLCGCGGEAGHGDASRRKRKKQCLRETHGGEWLCT